MGLLRSGYLALMKHWLSRYATNRLSASRQAHEALFGLLDGTRSQDRLLYCGIDLTAFAEKVDASAVRAEFGIPQDAFVLGHVGRFVPFKNHSHVVAVAAAVLRRVSNTYLLLVGDGNLRPAIEDEAVRRGVRDRVIFAGGRGGVARLLRAMDVFVFPSQFEGLGLAAVEAQAAGLPCILSEGVPEEATVVAPLVRRVALSQSAAEWAEAILSIRAARPAVNPDAARARVAASPFNVHVGIGQLQQLYASARRGEEVLR
jgi:glycosyltransferase involved in cell wall biosynthesis